MELFQLACFSLVCMVLIYGFNSIVSKRFKKFDLKIVALYVSVVAMIGVFGEVLMGNIYSAIFDLKLWEYRVLPVHDGYTSYYSLIIWGMYGFYLYLFHAHLKERNVRATKHLALIFSVEAIVLEILFNLSFLVIFDQYIFYYHPSDLWHLTSIQALPLYFLAGYIITGSMKRFIREPVFFTLMSLTIAGVLVFFS